MIVWTAKRFGCDLLCRSVYSKIESIRLRKIRDLCEGKEGYPLVWSTGWSVSDRTNNDKNHEKIRFWVRIFSNSSLFAAIISKPFDVRRYVSASHHMAHAREKELYCHERPTSTRPTNTSAGAEAAGKPRRSFVRYTWQSFSLTRTNQMLHVITNITPKKAFESNASN